MLVIANKNGQLGIDNIKRIFTILLNIYARVRRLIKEFNLLELMELVSELIKYKDDLKIFELAWNEIKDLDEKDGEVMALVKHLELEAIRLGLPQSNVLAVISETLLFITEIFELWQHGVSVYEKGKLVWDRIRSINLKQRIDAS